MKKKYKVINKMSYIRDNLNNKHKYIVLLHIVPDNKEWRRYDYSASFRTKENRFKMIVTCSQIPVS